MAEEPFPRPRVSVIVRTRNRPSMLSAALGDILRQTFTDLEIVVVDDGDDSGAVADVIKGMATTATSVRIVDRTSLPHGRSIAANAGISAAQGEFVVLHDDDDQWLPTFLASTVARFDAHPEAVAVCTHTEVVIHRIDAGGVETHLDRGPLNPGLVAISIPDMLRANRISPISLLYRPEVHHEVGPYDETLTVQEDWEFYLRLIARHPIDLLPPPALAQWHHRPHLSGDDGNSVFALDEDHLAASLRVRDQRIRESMAREGSGPALHLAVEMQRLEDEFNRVASTQRDLALRLDQISQQIADVHAHLGQVLVERTSISASARKVRRHLRRRR